MTRTVLGHSVPALGGPRAAHRAAARFMADLEVDGRRCHAVFVRSHVAHGRVRTRAHRARRREAPACTRSGPPPTSISPTSGRSRATRRSGGRCWPATACGSWARRSRWCSPRPGRTASTPRRRCRSTSTHSPRSPIRSAAAAPAPRCCSGTARMSWRRRPRDARRRVLRRRRRRRAAATSRTSGSAPVTMEANGCVAVPEADGSLTVWASTQSVFGVQGEVAAMLGVDVARCACARAVDRRRLRRQGRRVPGAARDRRGSRTGRPRRCGGPRPAARTWSAMTHGRGQVHDVELGATRDGTFTGLRVRGFADVGAYADPWHVHPDGHADDGVGRVRDPEDRLRASTPVVTNTTPDRPVPRRRAARGRRARRARRRRRWPRARDRSRRAAAPQLPPRPTRSRSRPRPARPTTAASTRPRSTTRSRSPATTSCAPSSERRARDPRRAAARHRRRPATWRPSGGAAASSARSRCTTTAPSRSSPAACRTAGPRDDLGADRVGHAGRAVRRRARRALRHRARRPRRRHVRLPLAAARRLGGARGGRGRARAGARGSRRSCSRPRADDIVVLDDGRARRRRRSGERRARGPSSQAADAPAATAARGTSSTSTRRARSRSAATSRSSRSTARPGSVDAARHRRRRRLRRRHEPAARRGAGARRARAGHRADPVRGRSLRRRRQPAHRVAARLPVPVGRRAARRSRPRTR